MNSPHNRILPQLGESPLIMGVLNVSTDSFSDGGKYFAISDAIAHARNMISQGADIIDIGAESTRPNAALLSEDEEIARLIPQIKAFREEFQDIPLSVDTYKPKVAELAVEAGADIINDVFATIENGVYKMAQVAARLNAPIIVTHNNRGETFDGDFFDFFMDGMRYRLEKTLLAGVPKKQIILDPGFGFGKTPQQNFEIVKNLSKLRKLGCAILLGVSRKSTLSGVVGSEISARDDATAIISAYAVLNKSADIVRVHDIAKNLNAIKIAKQLI